MEQHHTAATHQFGAALSAQRFARVALLRRQSESRLYWVDALMCVALLCYGAAYYVDRHASALLGIALVIPAYISFRAIRIAKRRQAAKELVGELISLLPPSPNDSHERNR